MSTVNEKLCGLAIDECDTGAFEKFCQSFHAAIVGTGFVPLGGIHDGGADGFEESIFESSARASTFLQISKTPQIEVKIRKTIKRLAEFGRETKAATFYFSSPLATVDALEESLSNELDIAIRIRSKTYIVAHINSSEQAIQAYKTYLEPSIHHLLEIGGAGKGKPFPFASKSACAFIGQELNRRRGNATVLEVLTDALILWSLEGTDPSAGRFLTYEEILIKVTEAIPASRHFIKSNLKGRLDRMSSKANVTGREISWHRKDGGYALRFEERQKLISENAEELEVFSQVGDGISVLSRNILPEPLHKYISGIVTATRNCLEAMFRKQGLDVGLFVSGGEEVNLDNIDISDEIDLQVDATGAKQSDKTLVKDCIVAALRKIVYSPSDVERDYMQRLSATYFVLFALKNDPRVVEYFNGMSKSLSLYVGSDLIIKAMSEYHLPESGQMITNTLKILKSAGAELNVAETTIDEVFTHMHASILEFENFYAPNEASIGEDFIQLIDRILIRSYFYAKLGVNIAGKPPKGWRSYIGQFCSYEDLRKKHGQRGLQLYLCDKFGLTYEDKSIMLNSIDRDEHAKLARAVLEEKGGHKIRAQILAYNDALHALRVFAKRISLNEETAPNPFGYRTWWLTHERATERAAAKAFLGKKSRFVMRPEFLLNYIGFLPSKAEVLKSYKSVFPTILGVSLGRRAPAHLVSEVLKAAQAASEIDESRAKVMLSEFADKLKTDQLRIYESKIVTN